MSLSPAPPAIDLKSISKSYSRPNGSPIAAVQKLDLSVESGQIFGLLGPNGAGKTTTIKMICSLVRPTEGHIHLNGFDVLRQRKEAMRQIGAVLEGARNIYWRLSAMQNLLYFGRLKGSAGPMKEQAEALLSSLNLWERRNDEVRFFSRGMQQKVALAAALMGDPPILLLDEPTLGLDIQAARSIKILVKKLADEQGKTIVLTTHHLDIAQEVCHRVGIMRQGQLITDQPIQQLLALFREDYYQIQFCGSLNDIPPDLTKHLSAAQKEAVVTLSGPLSDDQLYALLAHFREFGLPLISVNKVEPDLEEVFMKLVEAV
jgi:ABC-2 type transport system ATP-binding protein